MRPCLQSLRQLLSPNSAIFLSHQRALSHSHRSAMSTATTQHQQQHEEQKAGDPKILSTEDVQPDGLKWIKLRKIHWQDQDGKKRLWESAERTTRSKGGIDAVAIFALLHHPNKPTSTIIIEQYRPPIGKVVIEFPAGLVDADESAEETALRELHEETGYGSGEKGAGKATIADVTPVLVSDPGLTSANMKLVTVNVNLTIEDGDTIPEPKLDEGEHIVKRLVEMKDLWETLMDYDKKGFTIDARLAHFALGWHMSGKYKDT